MRIKSKSFLIIQASHLILCIYSVCCPRTRIAELHLNYGMDLTSQISTVDTSCNHTTSIYQQGLLVLVLYAVVRNPLFASIFGPTKASYSVSSDMSAYPDYPANYFSTTPSIKGSEANLLNDVGLALIVFCVKDV